jgi:hypothetical protein
MAVFGFYIWLIYKSSKMLNLILNKSKKCDPEVVSRWQFLTEDINPKGESQFVVKYF